MLLAFSCVDAFIFNHNQIFMGCIEISYFIRFREIFSLHMMLKDTTVKRDEPLPPEYDDGDDRSISNGSRAEIISWGLDRIDQMFLPLDSNPFMSSSSSNSGHRNYTGSGVGVYILDAGIRPTHTEFVTYTSGTSDQAATSTSRVRCGLDVVSTAASTSSKSLSCSDGSGHGTHVAGIIGGTTYGVAPDVTLTSVRVLDNDGNGDMSGVIRGVNYVIQERIKEQKQANNENDGSTTMKRAIKPIILNMSLGGGVSQSLNTVIAKASSEYNIHVVVSAGNNFRWACNQSPAMSEDAITVGATTSTDKLALYSNWGSCVDILAYVLIK
jgi:subtilisin family serine protease